MIDRSTLLFALPGFRVLNVTLEPDGGRLVPVGSLAKDGGCPSCGVMSSRVKERPTCRLKDLPHGCVPLRLWVCKRRFVCAEELCSRGSFTEVSDQVVATGSQQNPTSDAFYGDRRLADPGGEDPQTLLIQAAIGGRPASWGQWFDASPEIKNVAVADGVAALEAVFVGTHVGDFAGVAPTGAAVRLTYSVVLPDHGVGPATEGCCFSPRLAASPTPHASSPSSTWWQVKDSNLRSFRCHQPSPLTLW